ncbi:MAG: hypothetical protein AB2658_02445 [Candidatus Thiodiazotropha endolucinida]
MSFAFGTLTLQDLDSIHNAVSNLNKNQQNIMHLVEQNLSLLNASRIQIAENRQAIIDLVATLHQLDAKLDIAVKMLNEDIIAV